MAMFGEASLEVTNKDKIRYLKRFALLDKEIKRKQQEIDFWRSKLVQVTSAPSHTPKGGGSIYGKTGDIVAKIADLETEITKEIDILIDLKKDIINLIEQVEDDQLRLLLTYRYVDRKTFEWIAGELELSWQWTHELHSKALRKIM